MLTPARLRIGALVLGAALTLALVPLSKASGDQLNLLARGWLLAAQGELVPYGNPLSSGGNGPGALTSLVVGAPLFVVRDYRAPVALVALTHLLALFLLDRTLRDALAPLERAAYALLFALLPWRVEASATLWNPNYLFLVGAIHLATARVLDPRRDAARRSVDPRRDDARRSVDPRRDDARRFVATLVHVVALGLGAQLHPSVLLLGVLSLLLWWRGWVRPSWGGFAAGVALVAASLAPWIVAVAENPAILGGSEGFPFRGLLFVFPLLKGLSYWLRYPTLAMRGEALQFDFSERLGADVDSWLTPLTRGAVGVGAIVTVALAVAANVAFFRGRWRALLARRSAPDAHADGGEPRRWLESYAALALLAAIAVFAATPTTPQAWQAIPLFHAALLPVAFGAARLAARWGERRALAALAGAGVCVLAVDLALALGAPSFRCAGRDTPVFPLRAHSAMFEELGLQRACPWPLGVPDGWWPDVLPEE